MAKLLKILGRSLGILFEWLLIFLILFAFAIRTPAVQTYLAKQATAYLSEELGTEFKIDQVAILFFDEIALDGVLIRDLNQDTIVAVKTIYIGISDWDLKKSTFYLKNVAVENATIHIVQDEEGEYNFQFIKDYFKSPSTKKQKPPTLYANEVTISNTFFTFDDNRKKRRTKGVDYFHIYTTDIECNVKDFKMIGRDFYGDITHISCREKSGFELKDFKAKSHVSEKGIYLAELAIKSKASKIYSQKLNMISSHFEDFRSFEDSVSFDAIIDSSSLSLKEVALFAYVMDGMEDQVRLSTKIKRKVKNLKLADLNLQFKEKTQIKGTFGLPDRFNVATSFLHEKLDYVYVDFGEIKTLKLPFVANSTYITINKTVNRLGYIEAEDTRLDGFSSQFVIASDLIKTQLGNVRIDHGIMFTKNEKNNSYEFEQSQASNYDVKVENFDLGKLIASKDLGIVDGKFFLSGEAFSIEDIRFKSIQGDVNRFDYLGYPYKNITVVEGTVIDDRFTGKIEVKDDNLELTYDGYIDFKNELHLLFNVNIEEALLEKLHLTDKDVKMSSLIEIDLYGKNPNDFRGKISLEHFSFEDAKNKVKVPQMDLTITRSVESDKFILRSSILDADLTGKLNVNSFSDQLELKLKSLFPGFFSHSELVQIPSTDNNNFEFNTTLKETDDLLAIFYPELAIAPETKISGNYYGQSSDLKLNINSPFVTFKDIQFTNIKINNAFDSQKASSSYEVETLVFKDTINFSNVKLTAEGSDNRILSKIVWDENTPTASKISWQTRVEDLEHYSFRLHPSYFTVQGKKWEIVNESRFSINSDTVNISNFRLKREDQNVYLNGTISNDDSQKLNFKVEQLMLNELSVFFSDVPMEGVLNAQGNLSNPFNNLQYFGDATIKEFFIKNNKVGDVSVTSEWINENKSMRLNGNILFRNQETFDFQGSYFPLRKKDNIDFNLVFNYTDIQFVNAFMNPDVLSDIKGLLYGTLKVNGSIDEPYLNGDIDLVAGSAHVDITGAHFGVEGKVLVDKDGFYINTIPIYDEDGNAGTVVGSVYHDNFKDFNFDLMFDLEDDAINRDPLQPWKALPLERFLILNTDYRSGDIYYGKGYATGVINLFGYTDNLAVTVNLETKRGTKVNIPMFGVGEIEDENNFIVFIDKDSIVEITEPKIDFTGVDLDLNFKITPEAEVKIIFNEELGDIITARGKGEMSIKLDNLGDVTMNGVYTVSEGVYDFAMGIIKQKFFIDPGGSISWTGDPYDAVLDMKTFYKVNANLSTVTGGQFGSGVSAHQEILCYLELQESLLKPTINFDIQAPRANETERSILNRIKSDPDELNRQFFSLLLWKSFQPLAGTAGGTGSAALDLVSNQINALLSKLSSDYILNVNMNADQLSGDNTYEFGVSKGFLDDRLIFSGSFGVENQNLEDESKNALIGDVSLEYLLNQSGTFRVNIFNESNDNALIESSELGKFTQGVGLYYKEDFSTFSDFKAIQYFFDIFRSKKNKRYPIKRKKKQVPVPTGAPKDIIEPE